MRSARPLLFLTIVVLALGLSGSNPLAQRTGLAERVGHHDPSRYRPGRSHGSVGDMNCMTLLPGSALCRPICISCIAARSRPVAAWAIISTTPPRRCS